LVIYSRGKGAWLKRDETHNIRKNPAALRRGRESGSKVSVGGCGGGEKGGWSVLMGRCGVGGGGGGGEAGKGTTKRRGGKVPRFRTEQY